MTRTIDIATLRARHADGALVLDVREPAEYVGGHVPGAILAPMSRITASLGGVPKDQTVHVICQSGNRSWMAAGLPVVRGPQAA